MPLTPLHYGVLAPVNHWLPGQVSLTSFTLINLWMDGGAIQYFVFGLEVAELHGPTTHSLLAALVWATALALAAGFVHIFGITMKQWIVGAYYGAVTHVLLDMLVHSEMQPLYPIHWNPFYIDAMEALSLILLPFMIWFIGPAVSSLWTYPGAVDTPSL